MEKLKILIIEDEENIREPISFSLRKEGFDVYQAIDGQDGINKARLINPNLVLLDVMLPIMDGLDVCRVLKKEFNMPVFMLSAKGEEIDRVVGLELGADDYIVKPFSMRELLVRIRNILKRYTETVITDHVDTLITVNDIVIDKTSHKVLKNGQEIDFKPREFELLYFMATNAGKAISRHDILEELWGHNYIGDIRTVDVHIRWIREKIELDPSSPIQIVTIRGLGYRFNA
jgi:DNA-binding response OmpR family regulator